MSLYSGYYKGPWEQMPPPVLTEIPKTHYDPSMQPTLKTSVLTGSYYKFTQTRIATLNGYAQVTEFAPGQPWSWAFQCDEFHYILQGKAEMVYSLGGTHHTERKTMQIEAGDIYLIPLGARIEWKIDPKDPPVRALNIIMPRQPVVPHGNCKT